MVIKWLHMEDNIPITIRFTEDLRGKITDEADKDRRSYNQEVLVLLEEAITARLNAKRTRPLNIIS